ncbi:hypothetical protein IEQ34_003053 [Dendrobium chrysotoxum]|uniref:Pentatricopeptide repeat-containing protein n=1 Tax=Dendrobium chrysotoxum TaxID=161865 RepID=A0AAV7HL05_DENCH|nr:hypothetical protein IEQ34_003053 [Dendrobium chrysotoxum]
MKSDYDIIPVMKHYACMVVLYGRAGNLNKAFDFVREMPLQPSKFLWGSLLSSCKKHKNRELGELEVKRALLFDQFDVGNYVLLCRIYAEVGRWEDAVKVRLMMKEVGVKEIIAFGWMETKERVYRFHLQERFNVSCGIWLYSWINTSNMPHNVSENRKSLIFVVILRSLHWHSH